MASTEKELGVVTRLVICAIIINSICSANCAKTLFVNSRPDSTRFVTIQSQSPVPLSDDSIISAELPGGYVRESTVNHQDGAESVINVQRRVERETSSVPLGQTGAAGDSVVTLPANSTSAVSHQLLHRTITFDKNSLLNFLLLKVLTVL